MIVIGDVHGKINKYHQMIRRYGCKTIQVGDFGFKLHHNWHLKNVDSDNHKINFGNHDDYNYLHSKHSLGDYSYFDGIMTVRGAYSIDRWLRTEGLDWWCNEELSYADMQNAIDFYVDKKPDVMITHDCPRSIRKQVFNIHEKSITSDGLQAMFESHQPKLWIFGHHHKDMSEIIDGCRFICLDELSVYNV